MTAWKEGFKECQGMVKKILEGTLTPEEKLLKIKVISEMNYEPSSQGPTKRKVMRPGSEFQPSV